MTIESSAVPGTHAAKQVPGKDFLSQFKLTDNN